MTETPQPEKAKAGFDGLRVLSLESRRSEELARLIRNYGGEPVVAPSMREVPLANNQEALELASAAIAGRVPVLILLTGGGTRVLLRVVENAGKKAEFVDALRGMAVIARGPKPVAALGEVGLKPTVAVPEPNTWRELIQALDARASEIPLKGRIVAVQEYGTSNQELLQGLSERGAQVMRVPVYDWQLPEDVGPLREAVNKLVAGDIEVALFTTSVQARHLMHVAEEMDLADAVRGALAKMAVGSIGPVTSEELRRLELPVDMEPSHPKMGFLVKELAEQSREILGRKKR